MQRVKTPTWGRYAPPTHGPPLDPETLQNWSESLQNWSGNLSIVSGTPLTCRIQWSLPKIVA